MERSELCEPRYLRNVNSRRNGTYEEDNIVYTYTYTPLISLRVPTGSPSIFVTFFFYFSPSSSFPLLARRIGQEWSRMKYQLYFPSDSILKALSRDCCDTSHHGMLMKLCFLFGFHVDDHPPLGFFGFIMSVYRYLFLQLFIRDFSAIY